MRNPVAYRISSAAAATSAAAPAARRRAAGTGRSRIGHLGLAQEARERPRLAALQAVVGSSGRSPSRARKRWNWRRQESRRAAVRADDRRGRAAPCSRPVSRPRPRRRALPRRSHRRRSRRGRRRRPSACWDGPRSAASISRNASDAGRPGAVRHPPASPRTAAPACPSPAPDAPGAAAWRPHSDRNPTPRARSRSPAHAQNLPHAAPARRPSRPGLAHRGMAGPARPRSGHVAHRVPRPGVWRVC